MGGSLTLISGEPGIGKSTILLQLCGEVSNGMLLAGDVDENDVKVVFVDSIPAGTKLR